MFARMSSTAGDGAGGSTSAAAAEEDEGEEMGGGGPIARLAGGAGPRNPILSHHQLTLSQSATNSLHGKRKFEAGILAASAKRASEKQPNGLQLLLPLAHGTGQSLHMEPVTAAG